MLTKPELEALQACMEVAEPDYHDDVDADAVAMHTLATAALHKINVHEADALDFVQIAHSAYFTEYRDEHESHNAIQIRFPSGYFGRKLPPEHIRVWIDR